MYRKQSSLITLFFSPKGLGSSWPDRTLYLQINLNSQVLRKSHIFKKFTWNDIKFINKSMRNWRLSIYLPIQEPDLSLNLLKFSSASIYNMDIQAQRKPKNENAIKIIRFGTFWFGIDNRSSGKREKLGKDKIPK